MSTTQWITLGMYLIAVAIWVGMAVRIRRAGKAAPRAAWRKLIIMTVIVLGFTALQFIGMRQ